MPQIDVKQIKNLPVYALAIPRTVSAPLGFTIPDNTAVSITHRIFVAAGGSARVYGSGAVFWKD